MRANLGRHAVRGFSLLELIAVMTLLGILAAVTAARFSRSSLGNVGARADAQRLAAGLMLTRRQAIATGNNHVLTFIRSGGTVTGYQINSRQGGALTAVGTPFTFQSDVLVSAPSDPEFNFQGEGLAAYSIQLSGTEHTWRVTVNQITGVVSVARAS